MSSQDFTEQLAGKLIQVIEEISPEKIKSQSHAKYMKHLLETVKITLSHDGTRLLMIIQAIKDSPASSYKRDTLVELLHIIIKDDDILAEQLIRNPFGSNNWRISLWREFANSLTSIPDLIASCHLCERFPDLSKLAFYKRLLNQIINAIQLLSSKRPSAHEHHAFLLQLLGRIALTNKELVWTNFTSPMLKLIGKDDIVKNAFGEIFWLPFTTENLEIFIEQLHLPIFHYLKPSGNAGIQISCLLGPNAIKNVEFVYAVCNRSLLRANFNIDQLRQKAILFNIFSYLSTEPNHLIETVQNILSEWSDGTKILLRLHEQNRYLTWALLISFRYALSNHQELVKHHVREYQSTIARAIPMYLSRSDGAQRDLGICVADLILPQLHKLITSVNSSSDDCPNLISSSEQSTEYRETHRLFHQDLSDLFKCSYEMESEPQSSSSNKFEQQTRSIMKQAEGTLIFTNKKVIDSDEEDRTIESDNDDEVFGEELAQVPIYLRDCIDGLNDHKVSARYTRLCLARAIELIEKINQEKLNQSDIVKDVAIELTRTVLFLENKFNLDNFDSQRIRILSSLCYAVPDLAAKYLIEEFNSSTRSLRHQLDILLALVTSAQHLCSGQTDQQGNKATKNEFAKFSSLYFYGIVNRLKDDLMDRQPILTTLKPRSILSSFRETVESKELFSDRQIRVPMDRVAELDSIQDDSYLLSRIFSSISIILNCSSQHHVLCRISSDLLKILKAYRCHPDIGVQKSMIDCLKTIQSCTPKIYFEEYLERSMVQNFGAWLDDRALAQ